MGFKEVVLKVICTTTACHNVVRTLYPTFELLAASSILHNRGLKGDGLPRFWNYCAFVDC